MSDKIKIVMLAGEDESTIFIYNALIRDYIIDKLIIEKPVPTSIFLRRRIKCLGIWKVFSQVLFAIIIQRLLRIGQRVYLEELKYRFNLDDRPPAKSVVMNVESVNQIETIQLLQHEKPDLVIVNGTRIISKNVLDAVDATFINIHAGITPLYRGVHGGYWAITRDDLKNCGVTIHLIDPGIDTGGILKQGIIRPSDRDSFISYPLLQIAEGINLLKKVIDDFISGKLKTIPAPSGESKLWYHPGIIQYVYLYLKKGIK